jgi:4a-hydroxytetrahydrobiopterin dehydratase
MKLEEGTCTPCKGTDQPLDAALAAALAAEIPAWTLAEKTLTRTFRFRNFRESMAFVNRVADLAEAQGHHPDILILYSRVTLTLSTHAIGGLSPNDFVLAARIDRL